MKKAAQKSTKVKKVCLRNTVKPGTSSDVVRVKKHVKFENVEESDSSDSEQQKDLSQPEFCSILKLADEIKKVQLKPNSELVKREVEKLPKQFNLNFDPQEKIYQDLISVEPPKRDVRPKTKFSHVPRVAMKKDPPPDFEKLLKPKFQPEYRHVKFIVPEIKKPEPEFDGRSIYTLMQKLNVKKTY